MTDALPIRTERLTLRQLRTGDTADFRRIVTHPDVGRMLFLFPADLTLDAARGHIESWTYEGAPPFRLAIEDETGRFVGTVGVSSGVFPSVYYFLDPAAAGRGYATETLGALVTMIRHKFPRLRLRADVFHDNPASMKVLEKIGFVRCGEGVGHSAARVEPAPIVLYRLEAPAE